MSPERREMVIKGDEIGLERACFDNKCPHFFAVDWGEDDADIISSCAGCLELPSLTAEWRDEDFYVILDGREVRVPLQMDVADRHITICTLNDVLAGKYEIRFLVFSHGSDTLGFAGLSVEDWRDLEKANADVVTENFLDPRRLPNLMTELTDATLPPKARARFERMLGRNSRR